MKGKDIPQLSDHSWLMDFAFLTDMAQSLSKLNLKLQGENKLVHELYKQVRVYNRDLELYQTNLRQSNLNHFNTLRSCYSGGEADDLKLNEYADRVDNLLREFSSRFNDFQALKEELALFSLPCSSDVNRAPPSLQLELNDLQEDDGLKQQFDHTPLVEFYSRLPEATYTNLRQFARKYCSMFGSTYCCEQLFSKVKNLKRKLRSRLTDEHLQDCLRLCTGKLSPDVEKLAGELQHQISH